jgi:tetratricopeptide (TPR) repeat protein
MKGSSFKIKIIVFVLLLVTLKLNASYRSEIYSAYINDKMDLWRNIIEEMEAIKDKSNELLMELVNYQYGYIGYCIRFGKEEEAKKNLGFAQKNIEILEKQKYKLSIINSYKSAFYGFRIGLNPISGPFLKSKCIDCAETAIKLDPGLYLGYMQLGNIKFNMPSAFGGSKKEALEYYLKAKEFIEKNPESLSGDWNYMNLLVTIGQTYTSLEDYSSALKTYQEILGLEPGFTYVKDDLYPMLLKKMGM